MSDESELAGLAEEMRQESEERRTNEQQERADDPDAAEIERLAKLPLIDYERERKNAAEQLGMQRVTILDKLVKNEREKLGLDGDRN